MIPLAARWETAGWRQSPFAVPSGQCARLGEMQTRSVQVLLGPQAPTAAPPAVAGWVDQSSNGADLEGAGSACRNPTSDAAAPKRRSEPETPELTAVAAPEPATGAQLDPAGSSAETEVSRSGAESAGVARRARSPAC